jgi:hypothetical protein
VTSRCWGGESALCTIDSELVQTAHPDQFKFRSIATDGEKSSSTGGRSAPSVLWIRISIRRQSRTPSRLICATNAEGEAPRSEHTGAYPTPDFYLKVADDQTAGLVRDTKRDVFTAGAVANKRCVKCSTVIGTTRRCHHGIISPGRRI